MSIVVDGLSHKSAPIEVREKLYFPEDTLHDALRKLMSYEGIRESLFVSTCNRVEIYASVADSARGIDQIKRYISEYHGIPREALEGSLYVYPDAQGVRHTYRLAQSASIGDFHSLVNAHAGRTTKKHRDIQPSVFS